MRVNGIGLTASVWYPPRRQTVDEAIAAGDIDPAGAQTLGYDALPVSDGVPPPDMAVRAARDVLDRADADPQDLATVLHASVHYQGHDAWSAPHYIANRLGADGATPIGLLQQCNGGAVGVELAALTVRHGGRPALVTTADRFLLPSWHRWLSDYGMAAGDAGTAVLVGPLGAGRPDLLLHAVATASASELELMHRGDDGLNGNPLEHSSMIDVRRPKRDYVTTVGVAPFVKAADDRITAVVSGSLREAGLRPDDERLRYAVVPRLGVKALADIYLPPLTRATRAEVLDLGRSSGHVGAGDLNASLAEVTARLAPGEYALVLNGGGGFSFTSVIVSAPL
ncbi:MAG: ketoacyl-ACP synthase III family protein [Thermocrispum sp.]